MPVDESVAAIFWPISPALPMPVMIALPLHVYSSLIASQNDEFKRYETFQTPAASRRTISRAARSCSSAESVPSFFGDGAAWELPCSSNQSSLMRTDRYALLVAESTESRLEQGDRRKFGRIQRRLATGERFSDGRRDSSDPVLAARALLNPHAPSAKKAPRKAHVPGGQRTLLPFRERLDAITLACGRTRNRSL